MWQVSLSCKSNSSFIVVGKALYFAWVCTFSRVREDFPWVSICFNPSLLSSAQHLHFLIYFLFINFLIRPVWRKITTWLNKLSFIQKYKLKRTPGDEIRSKKQTFTLFLCALKYSPYIGADKSNCDAFSLRIGSVECTLYNDNWMSKGRAWIMKAIW